MYVAVLADLDESEPCDDVGGCWEDNKNARSVFKALEPAVAVDLLDDAITWCAATELHKLACTSKHWRTEILTRC